MNDYNNERNNPNYNVIDYYENRATPYHKQLATEWQLQLSEEYYDNAQRLGSDAMYLVLKAKGGRRAFPRGWQDDPAVRPSVEETYPTKRFVADWLSRQQNQQESKQVSRVNDTIASIIVPRPLALLQVDYMYLYWNEEDGRNLGPLDEEDAERQRKADAAFAANRDNMPPGQERGVINVIDAFSRYAWSIPIKGNVNSAKAWAAMQSVFADIEDKFPQWWARGVQRIQTDKGSEFQGTFRDGLEQMNQQNPRGESYFRQIYGYQQRSQSQALVERLNGLLKKQLTKFYGPSLEPGWPDIMKNVLVTAYNNRLHGTTKRTPLSVMQLALGSPDLAVIKENIKKKAYKHKRIDPGVYKKGEYVRIRKFKPKTKLESKWTDSAGPLFDIVKRDATNFTEDEANLFAGVYIVHRVRRADINNPAKQTTYGLVAAWVKESKLGTVPSGQRKAKRGTIIDVDVPDWHPLSGKQYPRASYVRYFTKDALNRVPQQVADSDDGRRGLPIVENQEYEVLRITAVRRRNGREEFETVFREGEDGEFEPEWARLPRVATYIAKLKGKAKKRIAAMRTAAKVG